MLFRFQILQRDVQKILVLVARVEFEHLDRTVRDLVKPADAAVVRARLTGAHVTQDHVRRNALRGDDGVERRLLHETFEPFVVDLGDDLAHAVPLCVQRRKHVALVEPGEPDERVGALDAFLLHEVVVGDVAVDDDRAGQKLRDIARGVLAVFDDLDRNIASDKLLRKVIADASAAADDGRTDRVRDHARLAERLCDLARRAGHVDHVSSRQREPAGRDRERTLALDCADQHPDAELLRQFIQRNAGKHALFRKSAGDQFHMPAGKQLDVRRRREPQDPRDLLRRLPVRIDRHRKSEILGDAVHVVRVFGVADARDRVLRTDLMRDETGKQVDLVARRHGEQQVGFLRPRFLQHGKDRAVSDVADHVLRVADLLYD